MHDIQSFFGAIFILITFTTWATITLVSDYKRIKESIRRDKQIKIIRNQKYRTALRTFDKMYGLENLKEVDEIHCRLFGNFNNKEVVISFF